MPNVLHDAAIGLLFYLVQLFSKCGRVPKIFGSQPIAYFSVLNSNGAIASDAAAISIAIIECLSSLSHGLLAFIGTHSKVEMSFDYFI